MTFCSCPRLSGCSAVSPDQPVSPTTFTDQSACGSTVPEGRDVLLTPCDGTPVVTLQADTSVQAAATVTSTTADFLTWSTQRLPWSNLVHIDGDQHVAEEFLNAVNLI